ncbi:hypothetical protein [Treponema pedis]|uniref:hypothetical protein n=1 Tax=Treponema pedis TaxID=409322 RepID=UPI001981307D|nr:hypothetical protein [Treponema pedis]QSI03918.1 hypothetical protein DYQ05_02745 [Treponema pedis]
MQLVYLYLIFFFLIIFYLKLQKRFSGKTEIENAEKQVYKLISDITFHTEQSITILEDKLNETNSIIAELNKRILLAKNEEEKRKQAEEILKNIISPQNSNSSSKTKAKKQSTSASPKRKKTEEKKEIKNLEMFPSEPIKIYTKQILSSPNRNVLQESSFREQIIEMARKGLSVELIAEKVPLPIGEIELIVSMNV